MLATKNKTDASVQQDQALMTAATSLAAVRTLISAGFGCITFIRGLLGDDNFEDGTLTGSRNGRTTSTLSRHDSSQVNASSSTKIKTIKRNFSTEADCLLNYVENGIFDALEKQYLKSFVFAIYLDEKDPHNLVEAYTFSINYQNIAGTDVTAPIMSLAASISQMGLMDGDPVSTATRSGRVPTLGDVKRSVRLLVRRLITICQQLEPLPDRRYATFKIYYNDNTPQEYEPPHFVAGDPEKDRFFFSTHGVNQPPERFSVGGVRTGDHAVEIEIASICSLIPSPDDNNAPFTGHTHAAKARSDYATMDAKRKADAEAQLADAERRRVVWDADPTEEDAEGENDPEFQGGPTIGRDAPLGVRNPEDGVILPIHGVVRHGDGKHAPAPNDLEVSQGAETQEATQILETQATVIIPSAVVPTQEHQRAIETNIDADRGINTMEIEKMLDATGEDTQMLEETQPAQSNAEEDMLPSTPVPKAIDPVIINSKQVECDCSITDTNCETFICQGPCNRRLHTWCMGFHTAKEAAYSPYNMCLGCAARSQAWYDLLEQRAHLKLSEALAGLALYRRTLKQVYAHGFPGNVHALQKLIGDRQDAMRNLNRMEKEGFVESKTVQYDELGLLATETTTKNAKGGKGKKTNKKNPVKPQPVLVKTAAAVKGLERYFEPRGSIEQELLTKFRAEYWHPKKQKNAATTAAAASVASAGAHPGNVLVPSSSTNLPSQQPLINPPESQDAESQTQQETQMIVDPESVSTVPPPTPPAIPGSSSKRKGSTRSSIGQRKRLKVSLANAGIDLENFE